MNATTVRVERAVKAELDRLQGLVQAETGDRLSHSELLADLLRFTRRRTADFLKARSEPEWAPPTKAELDHLQSYVRDWGVQTDSSKVDEALYGGESA